MYRMHRIFCATAWEAEGERRAFHDIVGQWNERQGIPAGTLYVPVSLVNIHDKRPYQYTVDENIRASRHYILVLDDGWGPPERAFERDYRLALACAADPALAMRHVTLLLRTQPEDSPSPFAATLHAAGVPYVPFTGVPGFQRVLPGLLSGWLAADAADAAHSAFGAAVA
jgi:hypothetical protein